MDETNVVTRSSDGTIETLRTIMLDQFQVDPVGLSVVPTEDERYLNRGWDINGFFSDDAAKLKRCFFEEEKLDDWVIMNLGAFVDQETKRRYWHVTVIARPTTAGA